MEAKRDADVWIKFAEHNLVSYRRELEHLKVFDLREQARLSSVACEASEVDCVRSMNMWVVNTL